MTSTDARNNIGIVLPLREFMDSLQDEPGWDVRLQAPAEWHYAIVSAPLRVCCGVFDQLTQLRVTLPIAQVGETTMFFVRSGSAAAVLDSPSQATVCAALGVEVADRTCTDAVNAMTAAPDRCWIVPPIRDSAAVLPTASTVVAAIHAAHEALAQRRPLIMTDRPNDIAEVGATLRDADLALVRQRLKADGYIYLAEVPDGFDYLAELSRLGEPVEQYHGALIREVMPEPDIGNDVYSASNTRELTPHTESYEFHGLPPRHVVLWCVQPALGPGGETTLADGHQFLRQFTPDELEAMRSRSYEWRSSASLASRGVQMSARHPILEQHPDGLVMRYSYQDIVRVNDDLQSRYIDGGRQFFEANKLAIGIRRNAILIWDNWRMMHARNGFTDPNRHLRRVLLRQASG